MRPLPLLDRSARSFTVRSPVMAQSSTAIGSLLETETMRQATVAPHESEAATAIVTDTSWWFAGDKTEGDAATDWIVGGVASSTVTTRVSDADAPPPSRTVNVITCV